MECDLIGYDLPLLSTFAIFVRCTYKRLGLGIVKCDLPLLSTFAIFAPIYILIYKTYRNLWQLFHKRRSNSQLPPSEN